MISLTYRSFSPLPNCCTCCWKLRCRSVACKWDVFFFSDLILNENTYSAFEALWHGGNCSCRGVCADLKCRARCSHVSPPGPAHLCRELLAPKEGAFRESSHLLLLYCWAGKLNLLSAWWQIWFILQEFYCKLRFSLSLSFLPFPLNWYFPGVFKYLSFFFFLFFNLSFIASSSPRSVHFLFSEALPLGFVMLGVVYRQRGSTPYTHTQPVYINKKSNNLLLV